MTLDVGLRVNGHERRLIVRDSEVLCDSLRDRLELTGTKIGCREGVCGSCDVLVDGAVVRSCLTLTAQVEDRDVTTVEGLADGHLLSQLQQAFVELGAVQCGFCTPGMLMAASAALSADPDLSDEELDEALAGNLCRCTGYSKIVDAVKAARESAGR